MGDRANFGFRASDKAPTIFLYGHWAGHNMLGKLADALNRVQWAGRTSDYSYATRICVSDLVGDEWESDLGWGLSVNELCDNEHSVPIVDWSGGTVSLWDATLDSIKFTMSIPAFVSKFGLRS